MNGFIREKRWIQQEESFTCNHFFLQKINKTNLTSYPKIVILFRISMKDGQFRLDNVEFKMRTVFISLPYLILVNDVKIEEGHGCEAFHIPVLFQPVNL